MENLVKESLKIYYHVTSGLKLKSIRNEGIKQNLGMNGVGVYLSDTVEKAKMWRDIMKRVCLFDRLYVIRHKHKLVVTGMQTWCKDLP